MKLGSPAFKTLAVGVTLLNCVAASALSWYDRFDDAIRRFLVSGVDTSYVTFSANSRVWDMGISATKLLGRSCGTPCGYDALDGQELPHPFQNHRRNAIFAETELV